MFRQFKVERDENHFGIGSIIKDAHHKYVLVVFTDDSFPHKLELETGKVPVGIMSLDSFIVSRTFVMVSEPNFLTEEEYKNVIRTCLYGHPFINLKADSKGLKNDSFKETFPWYD